MAENGVASGSRGTMGGKQHRRIKLERPGGLGGNIGGRANGRDPVAPAQQQAADFGLKLSSGMAKNLF